MSYRFKGSKVILEGDVNKLVAQTLPESPVEGQFCIDVSDKKLKVWNPPRNEWIVLGVASDMPFDNSSNGFLSTTVQQALEEARDYLSIPNHFDSGTGVIQTTSTSYVATDLTISNVPAGTYMAVFSCFVGNSSSNRVVSTALYVNGAVVNSSVREPRISAGGSLISGLIGTSQDRVPVASSSIITLDQTSTVQIRWKTSSSTAYMATRELFLVRVL